MAKRVKVKRNRSSATRAQRYSIHARVRYRADDGPWHEGWTENMSLSGLLLHAEEGLVPNTPLDLVVELPSVLPGVASAQVVGRGRVVQSIAEEMETEGAVISAVFTAYTFGRPDEPESPAPFQS